MEYRIDYAPRKKAFGVLNRTTNSRLGIGILAVVLAGILLTNHFWPESREVVQKLFFPYQSEETSEAFEEMISDLKNGSEFSDVAAAFCKTVISNAQEN